MIKKIRVFVLCFAILLLLNSCTVNESDKKIKMGDGYSVTEFSNLNFPSILSYVALIEDRVVCQCVDEDSVNYVLVSSSGENVSLGSIPNFFLKMKQSALIYPDLYFFVSAIPDHSDGVENILIKLNLENGGIEEIENADSSIPGISTYFFDNNIITLKNIVSSKTTNTFIESYDIETSVWEKHMENSLDNETRQGAAVYGVCANQENIFVLYDVCTDKTTIDTYLVILDTKFQVVDTIKVDQEIHDYVLTSFISDMQAIDDYIYINNASNYGCLIKIEDSKLVSVFKGRNFEIASDPSHSTPIFYTRGTNQVYTIDDSGKLLSSNIDIDNGYTIQTILSNESKCFVVCYADDCPNYAYLIDKKAFYN